WITPDNFLPPTALRGSIGPPVAAMRSTPFWNMPPITRSRPSAEYDVMKGPTKPAVDVPPRKPYFSTRIVRAPLRAAAVAAAIPAEPPPTTSTSARSSSGTSHDSRRVARSATSGLWHERRDRACRVVECLLGGLHAEHRTVCLLAQDVDGAAHLIESRPGHARDAQDFSLELGVRHLGLELRVHVRRRARGTIAVESHLHDAPLAGQRADEIPRQRLLGRVSRDHEGPELGLGRRELELARHLLRRRQEGVGELARHLRVLRIVERVVVVGAVDRHRRPAAL